MKDISRNKKKIVLITTLSLILLFFFAYFIFFINIKSVNKLNVSDMEIVDSLEYICDIKTENSSDDLYILSGFIYKEEEQINLSTISLVLKFKEEYFEFPTYVEYVDSDLINKEKHGWSGFKAFIEKEKIMDNRTYDVYLLTNFNEQEKLVNLDLKLSEIIY